MRVNESTYCLFAEVETGIRAERYYVRLVDDVTEDSVYAAEYTTREEAEAHAEKIRKALRGE